MKDNTHTQEIITLKIYRYKSLLRFDKAIHFNFSIESRKEVGNKALSNLRKKQHNETSNIAIEHLLNEIKAVLLSDNGVTE